jgi:hypothetical protein
MHSTVVMILRPKNSGGAWPKRRAGSGGMSARLADLGHAVTAMDVVPGNFRLHDLMPFIAANLNGAF